MIIDYLNGNAFDKRIDLPPTECYVDGIKIVEAWYIDTDKGVVKTYDVFGDGLPHYGGAQYNGGEAPPIPEGLKLTPDGVYYRVVKGNVRLVPMTLDAAGRYQRGPKQR